MDALEANEAKGGWSLKEHHIQLLMQLFPGSHTALKCLLNTPETDSPDSSWVQRRQLFSMCLSAEDNSSSIEWRLPVSSLAKTKTEETVIICSPNTLLVDNVRRFELQLQHYEGSQNPSPIILQLIIHVEMGPVDSSRSSFSLR